MNIPHFWSFGLPSNKQNSQSSPSDLPKMFFHFLQQVVDQIIEGKVSNSSKMKARTSSDHVDSSMFPRKISAISPKYSNQ